MYNNNRAIYSIALLLTATLGFSLNTASAGKSVDNRAARTMVDPVDGDRLSYNNQLEQSDCRTYGVVWSGGVALRKTDRISPRSVRSRWQKAGENRIRCSGGNTFSRIQVADEPWIR